jgi:hypothetical protein
MAGDTPADGILEVVLRFPDEDGTVDATGRETLETETRALTFVRTADGGIGELEHRMSFVTWVVPLGANRYCLEDLWHEHPLRQTGDDEAPGGLAYRDVFLARRLTDGSLLFGRIVERANWRVDYWMLPSESSVDSPFLSDVIAGVESHGGHVAQDPWIVNWLWTFLPPETDYDPTNDIAEALQRIPRTDT